MDKTIEEQIAMDFAHLLDQCVSKFKTIRNVIEEQAKDECLWFIFKDDGAPNGQRIVSPITASEAYLQQELRRLHQVIEEQTAFLNAQQKEKENVVLEAQKADRKTCFLVS